MRSTAGRENRRDLQWAQLILLGNWKEASRLDIVIRVIVVSYRSGERHPGPGHAWFFRLRRKDFILTLWFGRKPLRGLRQVINVVGCVFLSNRSATLCGGWLRRRLMRVHNEQWEAGELVQERDDSDSD